MHGKTSQGRTRWQGIRQRLAFGVVILLVSLAVVPTVFSPKQAHATQTAFAIETANSVSKSIAPQASTTGFLGANAPQYVPAWLNTSSVTSLLGSTGINSIRFPGGSNADYYQWENNGAYPTPNFMPFHDYTNYVDPNMNFDAFMAPVIQLGQQTGNNAIANTDITVNYGSGTAAEAASWVAYANKNMAGYSPSVPRPSYAGASSTGHNYGIKYWEIGNEVYGDGTYGTPDNPARWEFDTRPGPTAYGSAVVNYSRAMKAVDSTIKVGVVLTANGNFPDGVTNSNSPRSWNDTVLGTSGLCNAVDFIALHWYPQQPEAESDAGLLAAPINGIAGNTTYLARIMANTFEEVQQWCPGKTIPVRFTEANSVNSNPGKQTVGPVNALFEENTVSLLYELGAQSVNWWGFVNGFYQYPDEEPGGSFPFPTGNLSSSLNGSSQFGDFGLVSNGSHYDASVNPNGTFNTVSEPDQLTPFPTFYAQQMLNEFIGGPFAINTLVASTTSNGLVLNRVVHRSGGVSGHQLVMLIMNNSPDTQFIPVVNVSPGETISSSTITMLLYAPIGANPLPHFISLNATIGSTQARPSVLPPYSSEVVIIPVSQ